MQENIIVFDIEEAPEGYLEEIMSGKRTLYDRYNKPKIEGKMAYHSYTTYQDEDSQIFILDFATGDKYCINDDLEENIKHTMNASFNKYGTHIVFMALYPREYGDEWDIFIYELATKRCVNLTKDNGYRNEDPRFSNDAMHVVYKQGRWDSDLGEMVYSLWEMDFETYRTYKLIDDNTIQSMPCYGKDKNTIYFSLINGSEQGHIARMILKDGKVTVEKMYHNEDSYSYFPVYNNGKIYFSSWHSEENQMDKILIVDEITKKVIEPKFNDEVYNVSDAAPINERYIVVSSTKGVSERYRLYLADIEKGVLFSLDDDYGFSIDDGRQQLGASCHITKIIEMK